VNIDRILQTLKDEDVDYILIGGVNFLLHHEPELTFDVDIWVADHDVNLSKLNRALIALDAAWGPTEKEWVPVSIDPGWLKRQAVYCLTTAHGALDIFRAVKGLEGKYMECRAAARRSETATHVPYVGLSDRHMLICQEALAPAERKQRRIEVLRKAIVSTQAP
jgi:hypothetical protein